MTREARKIARVCSAVVALLAGGAACSGDDSSSEDGDTARRDAGSEPKQTVVESYRVAIEVPDVAPGEEGTKCVQVRLGNAEPVHIGRVHNQLHGQSHHFVVSQVTEPTAREESLFDCPPFRSPLTGAPLTVTQKHDEEIVLPKGVGYALGADQLMHLELHYINTSEQTADVRAESELIALDPAAAIEEAGFVIGGSMDIEIPPHATHSTGDVYLALPSELDGVHYYAATGHTHQFGTNVRLSIAESETAEGKTIYDLDNFDWSAAEVRYFDPPLQAPAGGGFRINCSWNNTSSETVRYGESALSEMCFFWAYYYPKLPVQQTLIHY
ncbi:MAG TPA: hypothetical protein VJR89_15620 [Polyangiales bacterium]|nr:hypothetical protein [Polyangiales bacterium]